MDNSSDKDNGLTTDGNSSAVHGQLPDHTRRRFTRNAVVGSSVLLSLGNRAAWGATNCMSVATLDSFNPNAGVFASAPPGQTGHDPILAGDIHDIAGPETGYLGTDGVNSTCPDPSNVDGVCLVEGDCP